MIIIIIIIIITPFAKAKEIEATTISKAVQDMSSADKLLTSAGNSLMLFKDVLSTSELGFAGIYDWMMMIAREGRTCVNSSAPAETKRRINIETPYGNVTCAHVSLCSINLLVGIATRILLSPSADIYAAEETVKAILTDTSICSQRRSCNASSQSAEDGCHDYADQAGRELASSLCPSELWHICEPAVPCYEIRNESHNYIGLYSYGLCSYGLCSYGLYSFGLYSYGLYSYGLCSYDAYIVMAYIVIMPI